MGYFLLTYVFPRPYFKKMHLFSLKMCFSNGQYFKNTHWLVGVEAKANRARCLHHRGQDRSGALEWPVPGFLQDHGLLVPVGSWVPDLQRRQVQAGSNLSRFTVDIGCFFLGGNLSWFIRDFENIEVQYLLPLTFSKLYLPSTIPKLLLNHLPSAGSRSFLQVCYCTVQKENLMYTVKAMSTIVSFMQSPCTQPMPKFWTFFGQGNPGTLTEL
jgi:hypothetical protein